MKKFIIISLLLLSLFLVPVTARANIESDIASLKVELIQLLIQLISQLQAQIDAILAQQSININTPGSSTPIYQDTTPMVGSTQPMLVLGCTNSNSMNYNPSANQDDGSCASASQVPPASININQIGKTDIYIHSSQGNNPTQFLLLNLFVSNQAVRIVDFNIQKDGISLPDSLSVRVMIDNESFFLGKDLGKHDTSSVLNPGNHTFKIDGWTYGSTTGVFTISVENITIFDKNNMPVQVLELPLSSGIITIDSNI